MSNKKHILIVGSPSVHTSNFIHLMKRVDIDISFLAEETIDDDSFRYQEIVDVRSKKGILLGKKRIKKIVREINPDSIHIQQINRLGYFVAQAAVKLSIPFVATAWGSDVLLIPQKSRVHYNLTKFVLENAKHVTADSQNMIDVMKTIAPKQRYSNINFGVEFKTVEVEKSNTIYSNRLHEPLYQIDKIIHSFYEASHKNPDWELRIGGKGSLTENYQSLVEELGISDKVKFVGWLSPEENWKNYHQAKIYCSIPKSDGTAISLLEAMYAKCYPVVWNLPVAEEWIQEGNGLIVREGELDFIERAINSFHKADLEENKAIVVSRADKNNVARQFLELHQS